MKTQSKIMIVAVLIALFLVCISVSVYATDEDTLIADIQVISSKGENLGYVPPESGGYGSILNTELDYSDCTFEMCVENNYGEEIKTDFGTFTFKEKSSSGYIYSCPVNAKDIKNKKGTFDLIFTATNIETNTVETLDAWFLFYKIDYKSNADLRVGETYIIKNGKLENDIIMSSGTKVATYDKSRNILTLFDYNNDIFYSNMGSTFNVETVGSCKYTITNEDTQTGVKLDSASSSLPKTVELVVDKVDNGTTYNVVVNTLKDNVSKFYAYDISLTNGGVTFQPNGKVKISIPIPNDIDTSNIVVYRVTSSGEKIEYKPSVETIDSVKYAVIETDHFSTYVLAEKKAEKKVENEQTNISTEGTNKNEKDNTPKTGTIDVIYFILPVIIISALGVVVFNKKH